MARAGNIKLRLSGRLWAFRAATHHLAYVAQEATERLEQLREHGPTALDRYYAMVKRKLDSDRWRPQP